MPRPRKKLPSFGKNLSEYFFDYTRNSTIQGVKYLTEKNRSWFEKLFWFAFLSISLYLCANLINSAYYKWQNDPVIVTFSNKLVHVWEIPFPAVTICPEAKSRINLYNYTDAYKRFHSKPNNLTEKELKRFEQMNFLCGDSSLPNGSATLGNDTIDFMLNIAPTFDGWHCLWSDYFNGGKVLLTPTLTDDGVCFSFNMLDREELYTSSNYYYRSFFKHGIKSTNWSLENAYSNELGADDYPRRSSSGGWVFYLTVSKNKSELDYGCRGGVQGYKVLFHLPTEIPRMKHLASIASFDKQLLITIKPAMMITSPDLESYDPQQRQCYFSYERKLKYFQVYTQSNCELECLTNHTLKHCGCVFFYMPRNTTTNICGRANYLCMTTVKKIMIRHEMKLENEHYGKEPQEKCNCMPTCTSLTYDTETSDVANKWKESNQLQNLPIDVSYDILTHVNMFLKPQDFIATERNELYGLIDFISNCGGLLGLFVGFSFLSIVEIIYFLTVRLICNVRIHGLRYWAGSSAVDVEPDVFVLEETCRINSPLSNNVFPEQELCAIDLE